MRCLRCGTENPDSANNCIRCKAILKRICPRCRAVNHPNQVFCGNCGLKLINVCPRCKTPNQPLQKFCGRCGLKIINFCPQCGMNNPISQRFCGNCASRLLPDKPSKDKIKQLPPAEKPVRGHQPSINQAIEKQGRSTPGKYLPTPQQQRDYQEQRPLPQKGIQEQRPLRTPQQKQLRGMPELTQEEIRRREDLKQKLKKSSAKVETTNLDLQKSIPKQPITGKVDVSPAKQKEQPLIQQHEVQKKQEQKDLTTTPKPESNYKLPVEENIVQKDSITKAEKTKVDPETIENPVPTADQIKSPFGKKATEKEELTISETEIQMESRELSFSTENKPHKPEGKLDIMPSEPQLEREELLQESEEEVIFEEEDIEELEDFISVEPEIQEEHKERVLERFAILTIEIANYNKLSEILESEMLENIKEKIWGIAQNLSQNEHERFIEIGNNIGLIAVKHQLAREDSSLKAIKISSEFFKLVQILNTQLISSINVQLKVKIGIALNNSDNSSQLERSIASAWSIVVSEEIKADTINNYEYDTIGPLPIGSHMVTFFKLKIPEAEHIIEPEKPLELEHFEEDDEELFEEEILTSDLPEEVTREKQPIPHQVSPISPIEKDKIEIPQVETKLLQTSAIVGNIINSCSLTASTGQGQFISIIGEDGMGKSTISREIIGSLNKQDFTWLIARCNYQEQLIPLSAIKDILRNLIGVPKIIYNKDEALNTIKTGIEGITGSNDQICFVLNTLLLGDEASGLTKEHIVSVFRLIMEAITQNKTAIILIEDLEAIDNSSFEVIQELIETNILNKKTLIISTFHPNLNLIEAKPELIRSIKYSQMQIQPIKDEDFDMVVAGIVQTNIVIPDDIKQHLISICQGNPYAIESALCLMFEIQVITNTEQGLAYNQEAGNWEIPDSLQEMVKQRLTRLSQYNPNAFYLLQVCSAIGPKLSPAMLQNLMQASKEFEEAIQVLNAQGYLIFEDQNTMYFKHNIIWELMYYAGITDEIRPQFHFNILTYLENLHQTGGRMDLAYLAFQAEMAGKRRKSLNYWNIIANQVLTIGFPNTYCEIMNKYINILEQIDIPNKDLLKINAMEEIAKVVHSSNPEMALQTISQIIPIYLEQDNKAKLIELKGYTSCALEKLGKYEDSVREIEASIGLLNPELMSIERIILMTSLISPMEKMGKIGWIINTCSNEILPVLEKSIQEKQFPEGMTEEQMFKIYCNTKISFANAMLTIGHHEGFQIFSELMEEIQRRGLQDTALKVFLYSAKAHSIRGEITNADQILNQTREYLQQTPGINQFSLMWGEAGLLYSIETENYETLKALSEKVKTQALKLKSYPSLALIKLCEAKLLNIEGLTTEALSKLNEMVNFALTYKIVTYALYGWYNIAQIELASKKYDKAFSIAQNALEVAKKPEIYNLYSVVELNRLIGEIFIRKGEVQNSGVPLEEAWKLATELQNHSQIARVAIAIALMYQELVAQDSENKFENATKSKEFLEIALNRFRDLGNNLQVQKVQKHIENLKVVCQINNINISG